MISLENLQKDPRVFAEGRLNPKNWNYAATLG